jgi:phosphotransferase system HPr (HPr) family protein
MLRRTVTIRNPAGLHMRAAAAFAKVAMQFRSTVTVRKQERGVNGKSWLNLITLAARPGTELLLEVAGDDAEMAMPILAEALGSTSPDGLETLLS